MTDNERLADRASRIMDIYAQRTDGTRADVGMLLTDLMHYCHIHGHAEFDSALQEARDRFAAECENTPAPSLNANQR